MLSVLSRLTILMGPIVLAACAGDPVLSPESLSAVGAGAAIVSTAGIKISSVDSTTLRTGGTTRIAVRIRTDSRTRRNPTIAWQSANPSIASVSSTSATDAVITAVGVGAAFVRVSDGQSADSVRITVVNAAVSLSISPTTAALLAGQSLQISATGGSPSSWTSSSPSVAIVSGSGLVTAISAGSTTITASLGGVSATAAITVAPVVSAPGTPNATLPATLDAMLGAARGATALRTILPRNGAELQRALDTARYGDDIVLDPSIVYSGNFKYTKRTGDGWITLRSSSGALPPVGTRVRPSDSLKLAKLESIIAVEPVLSVDTAARGLRVVGVEMRAPSTATMAYTLVELGSYTRQFTTQSIPQNLVLERVWIHGSSTLDFQRCVALQSGATAIVDSWLSDCHGRGYDSQAIAGWNGSGPYEISNNYLEGAGENVMFGGADPSVPNLVPSDIVIRRNHFYKPPAWFGRWTVKNLLEFKLGIRVLIENNILENNWADAQNGFSILFRSLNQSGAAPWSETRDITFRYNIVRNVANGLNAVGVGTTHPAVAMSRVYISNNSWEKVGNGDYDGGILWQIGGGVGVVDLVMENNTGFSKSHGLQFIGSPSTSLVFRNNVFGKTEPTIGYDYTISSAEGLGWGTAALNGHALAWVFDSNVLTRGPSQFPLGNGYVSDASQIGLTAPWTDLSLSAASPFLTAGTSNSTPGANFAALRSRTQGVIVQP